MKKIIVAFDEPVAMALITLCAERDAMLEVRLAGMTEGDCPKSMIEYAQREKSLCVNAMDTIIRACKGLQEPGQ